MNLYDRYVSSDEPPIIFFEKFACQKCRHDFRSSFHLLLSTTVPSLCVQLFTPTYDSFSRKYDLVSPPCRLGTTPDRLGGQTTAGQTDTELTKIGVHQVLTQHKGWLWFFFKAATIELKLIFALQYPG